MKLLNLTLTNFQGISSLTLDFNGNSGSVYGDNATGKTTIYNALTWLLFDKSSTGAKGFTPKTRGENDDLHHLEHSSEATFRTDDGRIVTLKKTMKEVYRKKRGSTREEFTGHTIDYEIDGVPTKEKDFSAAVLNYCGGDSEKIRMITMLDYFADQLPWDSRRKILLEVCGDITDEEIIYSNDELRELPDFLRMAGATDRYYSTEEYRKIASAKRADINKRLAEIPARIDEANKAIPDTEGLSEKKLIEEIADLQSQRTALGERRSDVSRGDTVTSEVRQRLAQKRAELAEARTAYIEANERSNHAVRVEISNSTRAAAIAEKEASDCEIRISNKEAVLEATKRRRAELVEEYQKISTETWDEGKGFCPTCHQPLPEEQVEQLKADFNTSRSERLAANNARGQKECSKDKIKALEGEIEALKQQRDKAKAQQAAEEARADEYRSKLLPTEPFESTAQYAAINAEIEELTHHLNDTRSAAQDALVGLNSEIAALDAQIENRRDLVARIRAATEQKKRIAELEKQEKQLSAEYEKLDKGLYLCDLFTKKKVEALTERINARFKSVRFRLFVEQINGGIKDDCEVMIPTDGGRLVPYSFANNAARINAGLEIISTLSDFWGIKMPIFVDNAESVTHLIDTDTQVIRLVVSEADKKLRLVVEQNNE